MRILSDAKIAEITFLIKSIVKGDEDITQDIWVSILDSPSELTIEQIREKAYQIKKQQRNLNLANSFRQNTFNPNIDYASQQYKQKLVKGRKLTYLFK